MLIKLHNRLLNFRKFILRVNYNFFFLTYNIKVKFLDFLLYLLTFCNRKYSIKLFNKKMLFELKDALFLISSKRFMNKILNLIRLKIVS